MCFKKAAFRKEAAFLVRSGILSEPDGAKPGKNSDVASEIQWERRDLVTDNDVPLFHPGTSGVRIADLQKLS